MSELENSYRIMHTEHEMAFMLSRIEFLEKQVKQLQSLVYILGAYRDPLKGPFTISFGDPNSRDGVSIGYAARNNLEI